MFSKKTGFHHLKTQIINSQEKTEKTGLLPELRNKWAIDIMGR